ncbi:MAG: SDR family NAD(P)-dependent oxidoreductase, partial [Planctomycetota bacterium]
GDYVALDVGAHLDMAKVHVLATMRLTHAALPAMLKRRHGDIVNVASMSAFLIGPGQVTYAATKAMLTSFSESLQAELEDAGVRVQALCPGFTRTGFHDRPAFEAFDRAQIPKRRWMTAEKVVDASLAALDKKKVICVPGWKNRLLVRAMGFRPVRRIIGDIVRKK